MLSSGASGTAVATDLGFPLAVLSLLAAIFGVPGKDASDDAKLAAATRGLARDVGSREGMQQQRFLADTGEPQPSDIGFAQPKLVSWPPFCVRTSLQGTLTTGDRSAWPWGPGCQAGPRAAPRIISGRSAQPSGMVPSHG
jgi:hypothetical protein